MALNFRKCTSIDDVSLLLKGHILGGVNLTKNSGALYLHGKTLIFTTPSETVTFAASPAAAQVPLTLAQVKSQIEAQTTGVEVRFNQGRLELFMTTPGNIVLAGNGTANAQLGFGPAAVTGTLYGAPGASAPALVQVIPDHASNSFLVIVNDS